MNILTERRMAQALHEFVDKDDKDAISTLVKWQLNMTQNHLKKRNHVREEDIELEVVKHAEQTRQREAAEEPDEHGEEIKKVCNFDDLICNTDIKVDMQGQNNFSSYCR